MTPYKAYEKTRKLGLIIPKLEPFELEPFILKDAYWSYRYALDVIKDRWELGEPTISKNAHCSYCYAKYIIKGRLPDFMHNALLLSNDEYAKEYIKFISKNPDSPNNKI